jgi:predicted transcriptional regulator
MSSTEASNDNRPGGEQSSGGRSPRSDDPREAAPLGERELALLRWVAERGPVTVGEAAADFGALQGIARTTVQTMLERLREKKHLERRRRQGVFRYRSSLRSSDLLRGLVRSFVEGTLGGDLEPFVAYLAERRELSPQELAELTRLVERLDPSAPVSTPSQEDEP